MAAGTGRDGNKAGCAFFDRLAGKAVINHVMQRNAAPSGDGCIQIFARTQRCDDNRHLPFFAGYHVFFPAIVRFVNDLVDGKGGRRTIRIVAVPRRQFFRDPVDPFIQLRLRTRIQRRERPDNPGLALGNDQIWP